MHVVLGLGVVGAFIALWAWLCRQFFGWWAGRARPGRARAAAGPTGLRPGLPSGHEPPPGLGPLSPSERFLTQEAARGLHELELFLVDQRTV